jgi:uncharacterized protein (TIGR02302 family)
MNEPERINEPPAGEAREEGPNVLERLVRRSVATLIFERAWRIFVALCTIGLFFLAISWSGLWLEVGRFGRIFGLLCFAAAAIAMVARNLRGEDWSRARALARLDAEAPRQLRPASSLDDTLAGGDRDPATAALWMLHRRRLEDALQATPVAPPRPRLVERDPFALRAAALIAAVAAGFAAGSDRGARLRAAFDLRGDDAAAAARLDAWLDPPAYTGLPPVVLLLRGAGDEEQRKIAAPVRSVLHVRSSGAIADVTTRGGLVALQEPDSGSARVPPAPEREQKFTLAGDARLTLEGESFKILATPDRPPTIALTAEPRNNSRGSLSLSYRTDDDYGVIGAEAIFSRALVDGKAPSGRALVDPPKLSLNLPGGRAGVGEAQSTLDLADHPWAGGRATMVLVARDEGGNEGFSAPVEITLPRRRFIKPLARALVEQRRNLVLDPDQSARTLMALEALSLGPDVFATPSSIFLGLQEAANGLRGKRSDDELRAVADLLWAMALSLEDGDLSGSERDLRAAERNLREALSRGAGEEEIGRLTDELRSALDRFLQALSHQAARSGAKRSAPEPDGSGRSLTEQDLKSMLDQMAKAGKAGDLAQAQQLLDDLQDVLENLQPSHGAGLDARSREMSRSLGEIDRLSREQQQLRDDTHRGRSDNEPVEARAMRDRQKALRDKLEQQQDRLRQLGEEASRDLGDADKAMKDAEEALGKGGESGKDRAVDAQGRALQSLRRGADQLASKMKGQGEDGADDEGQGSRPGRAQGQGQGDDPLGRSAGRHSRNADRSRYDPLGLPPAIRAHRVQEELRRRLGDPQRPAEELDYIERLLRR